jgi:uncharacterized protein (DUF433 family)
MTLTATEYKYVELDEKNVPILKGTTMKVVELITSVKAYSMSPEELLESYPNGLRQNCRYVRESARGYKPLSHSGSPLKED